MNSTTSRFVSVFGKMLLPEKFFMYNGRFYRIDSEAGLIWIVALDEVDSFNRCIVNYDVKAFCHDLDIHAFEGGMYQVQGLWSHYRERIEEKLLNKDPLYEIDVCGKVFQNIVLQPFVSIRNIDDFQSFRLWNYTDLLGGISGNEHWLFNEVWEHVQMEQYLKADHTLQQATERWLRVCQKRPAMLTRPDVIKKKDDIMLLQRMFKENDIQGIRYELERRINNSKNCMHVYFQEL